MNEEKISSKTVDTLVSFVGIRSYLVSEFLKPYLYTTDNNIKRIVLFSSKPVENGFEDFQAMSKTVMNNTISFIEQNKPSVLINTILLTNIWDIRACLSQLSKIKTEKASVNLSAGPSTFSIAAFIWAIENNHFVEHSVESINKKTGKLIVFRKINMIPYLKSIFSLDRTDKEILFFLKKGPCTTNMIRVFLRNEKKSIMTLRTIENRINKMKELDIVSISKGRNNIIELSDEYKKLS